MRLSNLRALQLSCVVDKVHEWLHSSHLLLLDEPVLGVAGRLPFILVSDGADLVHGFEFWQGKSGLSLVCVVTYYSRCRSWSYEDDSSLLEAIS
jgi:hypothetical protein